MKRYFYVAAVLLLFVVLCVGCGNSGDKTTTTTTNNSPPYGAVDSVKIPEGFVQIKSSNNNYSYAVGLIGSEYINGWFETSFYVIKLSEGSDYFPGFSVELKDDLGESHNGGPVLSIGVSDLFPKGFVSKVKCSANIPEKAASHIVSYQVDRKEVFPVSYDFAKAPDDYFMKFGQEFKVDNLIFTPVTAEETENKISMTVSVKNEVYTDKRVNFRFLVQTLDGKIIEGKKSGFHTVPGSESVDFVLEAGASMSNIRAYIIVPEVSSFGMIIVSPE